MPYCARYRFKILPVLEIPDGESWTIAIPGLLPATLELSQSAWPFGRWAVLKISGLQTEAEAWRAGQRLGDTLLIVGAVTALGIDIGFSRSTHQFIAEVHAAVKAKTGKELRTETHGLMVYEEDTVAIFGINAQGSALLDPGAFEQRLVDWIGKTSCLTDRQRNCAALLNHSFFAPQAEAQFILRISAVEALCDQKDVGADYQAAITTLEAFLVNQSLSSDVRDRISELLASKRNESVGQSCMRKLQTPLSASDAKAFDALYKKRSRFLHDGKGRGDLAQAANEAMNLAIALLNADLQTGK